MDESHLSDSTSTTHNFNESDTPCDHLVHLDSPSLSSELQDNSVVENTETESVTDFEDLLQLDATSVSSQDTSSIEIELFLNLKDNWTMPTFHQQMVSLNIMTMSCSHYKRRLMHHMTISVMKKLMYVKKRLR